MPDSSVSRGKFLRSLGTSVTGMAIGTGIASAAQALLDKVAAAEASTSSLATKNPTANEIPFHKSGPIEGNRIALTFDDGPTPGVTEVILDELKLRKISATFFMIGRSVMAAPDLARRVLAEGHEIGNHTFTHAKLTTLPDQQVEDELQKTQAICGEVLNCQPVWFRPPYGAFRQNQGAIAQGKGLGVVLWSVDSRDWAQPGEMQIVDTVLSQTQPGSIILCHDLHPQTAKCVGQLLDHLMEREFNFSTLSNFVLKPVHE